MAGKRKPTPQTSKDDLRAFMDDLHDKLKRGEITKEEFLRLRQPVRDAIEKRY